MELDVLKYKHATKNPPKKNINSASPMVTTENVKHCEKKGIATKNKA